MAAASSPPTMEESITNVTRKNIEALGRLHKDVDTAGFVRALTLYFLGSDDERVPNILVEFGAHLERKFPRDLEPFNVGMIRDVEDGSYLADEVFEQEVMVFFNGKDAALLRNALVAIRKAGQPQQPPQQDASAGGASGAQPSGQLPVIFENVMAVFTDAMRQGFQDQRQQLQAIGEMMAGLKLRARRPTPSHMSNVNVKDCDHFPDNLRYPNYPIPELQPDDAEGRNIIDKIKYLLAEARAKPPTGSEQQDRVNIIDPFLVAVSMLFNMHCWNEDVERNLLVLHDISVEEPKRTVGYVDKVVTMPGSTRPRLLGYEVKQIKNELTQKNQCQTMLYLEALRRHLPAGKNPAGALTNLKLFIFYRSTNRYDFTVSNPIEYDEQVALYLYDLHHHARQLNGEIAAACPSRTFLDVENPFSQASDGGGDFEGGGDGEGGGGEEATSNAGTGPEPRSTPRGNVSRLTAFALKRHKNAVAITRRRLLIK